MNDRIYIIRWNTGDTEQCVTQGEVHHVAWSVGALWVGSRIFDRNGHEIGLVGLEHP